MGASYVYLEEFQTVQLTGESDNPVILLDQEDRSREWNRTAESIFPAISNARGQPVRAVEPTLAGALDGPDRIIPVERFGTTRYYRITNNPFSTDNARLGTMITLNDASEREQYRQRLERENERLEKFASIVSHDLRNPPNVAVGRLELARETGDPEHIEHVKNAHDRMEELIEDLLSLARSGLEIDEVERVALDRLARECWEMIETGEATLAVDLDDSVTIEADRDRLRQLFENIYRNAIEHGGEAVTIRVGRLADKAGFYVEDDGVGISVDVLVEVFDAGFTTEPRGTGFGLAIVLEIVRGHAWEIEVTESLSGGARFEISGAKAVEHLES